MRTQKQACSVPREESQRLREERTKPAAISEQEPPIEEYLMIYEFHSHEAMMDAWEKDPGLRGPSPGGAAGELCITRQGVYSAVKRGSLDMVRLYEPGRRGPHLYITATSIERYKLNQGKPGPRPGFRQQAMMGVDKHIHGVWPSER